MGKWALYHDFDELKCETMREAIKAGAITDGEVICGDIKQLTAEHVRGFRQCHFFAGGGFWSLALRQSGWPEGEEVWTASCPCPSFSCAGKGLGFDDPRHLWPVLFALVDECRPPVLFGEQVSSKLALDWYDLVKTNLNSIGYSVVGADIPASAVGAPHIRQRLFFVGEKQLA